MRSIGEVIRWRARFHGRAPALSFQDHNRTFAELDRRTEQVANLLRARGAESGDRVAVLDKAHHRLVETIIGIAKAGAVYAPINWRLSAAEIRQLLEDCRPRLVFLGADYEALWAEATAGADVAPVIVYADRPNGFERLLANASSTACGTAVAEADTAWQIYTSGTTGRAKGVELTHANILASVTGGVVDYGRPSRSAALACMPLFHVGGAGYLVASLFAGSRVVLMRDADTGEMCAAMERERVSHALFVPAMLSQMLADPATASRDFGSLTTILYGGSPMATDLLRSARDRFGCDFVQGYGLTETSGLVSQLSAEDHMTGGAKLASCGKPALGMRARILAPDGDECGEGEVGEICVSGPTVMKGYWRNPEATEAALVDSWLRTGDAGSIDEQGYLWIRDRVKDMIVSGGENIYSSEVENALRLHPAVADVAVFGIPDARWGEAVKAVVVVREGAQLQEAALIDHCRRQIASYKQPRSIDFVDALPRNSTGKVLKTALREPYWSDLDRRVN